MRTWILGVPFDAVPAGEAVARIEAMLGDGKQHHVMTPNSEMAVAAARDPAFRALLAGGELNLPDSVGVVWMSRLTRTSLPARVTGVDTVTALCGRLTEEHTVFLLGAAPGVADRAAAELHARNPRLTVAGTFTGSPRDADAEDIVRRINAAAPRLLLVAYGAPAQDLWIAKHIAQLPSVRVAMGVGGTFDFLAGERRRAPAAFQSLGLEWAWRLWQEPRRIGRICTAVIAFPLLALGWRLRHGDAPSTPRTTPSGPSAA